MNVQKQRREELAAKMRGRAKLTDFGVGRYGAESAGCWTFGYPPGSPGYISPELIRQAEYSHSADMYSFGAVAWVLLTGGVTNDKDPRPPLGSPGAKDFREFYEDWKLLQNCIQSPAENNAIAVPAEAQDILLKLTQRKPESRPKYSEIRESALMVALHLPPSGSNCAAVEVWMSFPSPSAEASIDLGELEVSEAHFW